MPLSSAARRRFMALCAGTLLVTSIWAAVLLTVGPDVGQTVSNVGLVVAPVAAAFGCFWAVEGLGIAWPGGDLFIIALAAWYVLAAAWYIRRLRRQTRHARQLAPQHAR